MTDNKMIIAQKLEKIIRFKKTEIPFDLLTIYIIFLSGYSFTHGFYSFASAVILLGLWIFFSYHFFLNNAFYSIEKTISLKTAVIISSAFSLLLYGGLYQINTLFQYLAYGLLAVVFILFLFQKKILYRLAFPLFFCVFVFMIFSSPNPIIDVFDYLRRGAIYLVSGQNPYSTTYTKIYEHLEPNYYGYMPGTLLMTTPSVVFFGDPRYAFVAFFLLTVYLILKTASSATRWFYALLFFLCPMSSFILEQSYIEPMIIFFLSLFFVCLARKRYDHAAIIFGIALSFKQTLPLLIPFMLRYSSLKFSRLRFIILSTVTAVSIILPFLIWNIKDFIDDVVLLQQTFTPRYEGLTFSSLVYHVGKIQFDIRFSALIMLGTFLLLLYRKTHTIFQLIMVLFMANFTFYFFNKWAFVNYYYFLSSLLILAMVFRDQKKNLT